MLAWVIERVRRAKQVQEVVVATSTRSSNDPVERLCRDRLGVPCFRGPEEDVLRRYRDAAATLNANPVVRITGDCPLVDPGLVDRVVTSYVEADCDYASNVMPPTFPDGLDVEVIGRSVLERVSKAASDPEEREHVTLYIRRRPELFLTKNVEHKTDLSDRRWTVDRPEDLAFVRRVFECLDDPWSGMQTVLDCLASRPEVRRINQQFQRDETLEDDVLP